MNEWDMILMLLKDGHNDGDIARAMKPYWKSTQDDRLDLVQNSRRAYFGSVHNYANRWGKDKPQ